MYLSTVLSLVRTTFMLFLLCSSAILFTKDSNELVLNPIERMLGKVIIFFVFLKKKNNNIKVKRIAQNPLEAAKISEDEAVAEEELKNELDNKTLE